MRELSGFSLKQITQSRDFIFAEAKLRWLKQLERERKFIKKYFESIKPL